MHVVGTYLLTIFRNPTASFPGIEWKPYKQENPCYLSINKNLKLIEEKLRGKEFEFWKKLLQ